MARQAHGPITRTDNVRTMETIRTMMSNRMIKTAIARAAALTLVLLTTATMAHAGDKSAAITEAEVAAAQKAWGEGIVNIGKVHSAKGDVKAAAREHIKAFYAYGEKPVLFKPTLAAQQQFRGAFDDALSYFVGGKHTEDKGFALAPYTNVRWENTGTVLAGNSAMAMGNYYFTGSDGKETKVEYSFAYKRASDGRLVIVLHHSSLPFSPTE